MRFYDRNENRLVYLTGTAHPEDWDLHWSALNFDKLYHHSRNKWLISETKKYLPTDSLILEGGCGCADKVYSLLMSGYRAIGFDTAEKTIHLANRSCNGLPICVADIRAFPINDGTIDGYWSLGVFEHFEEGMHAQWREAARVIRPGGYFFITVPIMSPIRSLKSFFRCYPDVTNSDEAGFYQYAYSPRTILQFGNDHGFNLVKKGLLDGIKGLKDEVPILKPLLQPLYDSDILIVRIIRRVIDFSCRAFSGHVGYFVFRRANNKMERITC